MNLNLGAWSCELLSTFKKFRKGGDWELRPFAVVVLYAHVLGIQGLYFALCGLVPWQHLFFANAIGYMSGLGLVAGTHRLWTHRSYKAKLPLRIALMLMHSLSGHFSVIRWCRDHRVHHKFCETHADPYNIRRGVFFSHIGWTLIKEHAQVKEKAKSMDFSDLYRDPVIAFQYKYYLLFELILNQMLPVLIPYYVWGTPLYIGVCLNYFRFVASFHVASLGNSVAHTFSRKPYEKDISSADVCWLSPFMFGEAWHNFHHVFPWDYRATDIGSYISNPSTLFIDVMSRIGWAHDLKTVPDHVIQKRAERTGDGSWGKEEDMMDETVDFSENSPKNVKTNNLNAAGGIQPAPWGWGDSDISKEDKKETVIHRHHHGATTRNAG